MTIIAIPTKAEASLQMEKVLSDRVDLQVLIEGLLGMSKCVQLALNGAIAANEGIIAGKMQVIVVELSNLSLTSNLTMQTYANITSKIAETIIESYKWLDREKPMEKIAIRKLSIISTLAIEMADECEKLKERFTMQRQIISDVAGEITVARTDKTKQKEEQERLLVINKQRHTLGMAEVESFEELYAEAERNAEMARSDQKNAEEKEFTLAIIQAVSGLVEKAAAAGAGAMAGGPAGAAAALAAAASSKNQNNAGAAPSNVPKPETSAGDNLSLPDQPEAGGGTDPTPSETSVSANPPLPTKPDDISNRKANATGTTASERAHQEKMFYLQQAADSKRAKLQKATEMGILAAEMKSAKNDIAISKQVIIALHQALDELKKVINILAMAIKFWKQMGDNFKKLGGNDLHKTIADLSDLDPLERREVFQEELLPGFKSYVMEWVSLHYICQDYCLKLNEVDATYAKAIQDNPTKSEALKSMNLIAGEMAKDAAAIPLL